MDLPLLAAALPTAPAPLLQFVTQLVTQLVTQHLGALHPVEKALTLLLAFGPFVLLAVVVVVRRRQDAAAESGDRGPGRAAPQDTDR